MARLSLFEAHRAPPRLPLLGHALSMRADPLRTLMSLALAEGGMAPIQIGPMRGYLLSEPELVAEVLVTGRERYTRKTQVYEAMAEFFGRSILTSEGEDWRVHRRIVQPAFHKRRLASFASSIARITREALDGWEGRREPLDASDAMMRLTLKVVSEVLLGTETDEEASAIGEAIDGAQRYLERSIAGIGSVPRWIPTPRNLSYRKTVATLDRVAYAIIDERQRSGERGDDAVSMLLDARYEDGSPLPRERIRNEVLTLLGAGHETTANALSWTLMRLSQHPQVARKLEAEIDEVLGGRAPTFEDLPELTYTRWVFDEAMRLHPPAWATGRLAKVPHRLGGRPLEPGQLLLISPYVTHRRPDLWDNPEGFDPERWEALGARGALPPFTYYPFGGGTRKCVGEAFAYLEATLVLAMIAQRYRLALLPGEPVVPAPQITLGMKTGLWMNVGERPGRVAVEASEPISAAG